MKKKLSKKVQKKIIDTLDETFNFKIIPVLMNLFVLIFISCFCTLIIIGLRIKIFENYFQYIASIVMFIFLLEKILIVINNEKNEMWIILYWWLVISTLLMSIQKQLLYFIATSCCTVILMFGILYKILRKNIIEYLNTKKFKY